MRRLTSRRSFLRTTLAAATTFPFAAPAILRAGALEDKVRLGGVGCGGKGESDILETSKGQDLIAICDIDRGRLEHFKKTFAPEVATYDDWRRIVDRKDIDGITVSTPDHMHAPIALAAMDAGKHVYVQKPLTHDVLEARRMREMAERKGVITQMGNQGHSGAALRAVVQEIQRGLIGKVREAHAWTNRPIWPQGMTERPKPADVPDSISWDLWIGTAPKRPFAPGVYHPFNWRGWLDFGTGALGDMGCHIIDGIYWALELTAPVRVQAEEGGVTSESFEKRSIIHYDFPATEKTAGETVRVSWYDGGAHPPLELLPGGRRRRGDGERDGDGEGREGGGRGRRQRSYPENGILFVGEKGTLFFDRNRPRLYPAADFDGWRLPELEERNHYQEWVSAIRGDGKTSTHFGYAGPLTETVLLGNVALRFPKETLEWDAKAAKVKNISGANAFLERTYREGWDRVATAG